MYYRQVVDSEIVWDEIMFNPFAKRGENNNNSGDVPHPERPASDRQSSMKQQRMPNVLGGIQLAPKEAWKEPKDRQQDGVVDAIGKQTKNKRGRQSLWLLRTKRFCHEASVVGLRYVVNPLASPFRRSVWVVLLLVGAGFTTFQIQDRIRYYLSRPVNVNLRVEHAEEIRFPTVTICNENRMMRSAAANIGIRHLRYSHCSLAYMYVTASEWPWTSVTKVKMTAHVWFSIRYIVHYVLFSGIPHTMRHSWTSPFLFSQ